MTDTDLINFIVNERVTIEPPKYERKHWHIQWNYRHEALACDGGNLRDALTFGAERMNHERQFDGVGVDDMRDMIGDALSEGGSLPKSFVPYVDLPSLGKR